MPPVADVQVVPTNMLAELIEPILTRLSDGHEVSNTGFVQDGGPFSAVYQEVADYTGQLYESVNRRLYSIRKRETVATGIHIADPILLALNVDIVRTDLPIFPAALPIAREMVNVHHELHEEPLTAKEANDLARSLYKFSQAFLNESADEETIEHTRGQSQKRRERKQRQRVELQATRAGEERDLQVAA